MGQSASKAAIRSLRERDIGRRSKRKHKAPISSVQAVEGEDPGQPSDETTDYISNLPDECLALIFQTLTPGDRERCSLVCRRWWRVEGQSCHRLSLNAQADLVPFIPGLFSRFGSVTKLVLRCDRRSASIGDDALVMISLRCPNLARLKLRSCRELTDSGLEAFAKNCQGLKKLSCASCAFSAKGMNAVLANCSSLEELSIKRFRGWADGGSPEQIGPGVAGASLRALCLKELYNGQCFGPLIVGAKNLRALKLYRCAGDWDTVLQAITSSATSLAEVHLENIQVSDLSLVAISSYSSLETLHLVKTPECTDSGITSIAERCKLLRKLHIDGWKVNRIGDEGLIAVAKSCHNLQELVLIGVNPTKRSLDLLASNCQTLERLAFCASDSVGDPELSCIAAKCTALKKLCIKNCPVTDQGMQALANGCPNLTKVKVKKCRGVTSEGADYLRATRVSLQVNLDVVEIENQDASASDVGIQETGIEYPHVVSEITASTSGGAAESSSFMSRFWSFSRRRLTGCHWTGYSDIYQ